MSSFFANPETWVAIGFVAFAALVGRRMWAFLTSWLDGRTAVIKSRLDEARTLHEEARALVASYERKLHHAEREAQDILGRAREEAARVAKDAAEALETSIQRRQDLALERIANAEAKALMDVRDAAVDLAVRSAERLIAAGLDDAAADGMVDEAIRELEQNLQ